ncbi:penicillin-binding protein activator [Acetobacter sicerae]|uniref:Penicillin-binding protein activator n=1 Tax=Acetobacter sicerae TaxID=85325 RepID=A0ABS8VXM9_9PROT|nr:penicillin-binding protein activator [Acetobacter sicerae]MCE0744616.1 penicillin-binding protein activator [Acetobacter sicerae]
MNRTCRFLSREAADTKTHGYGATARPVAKSDITRSILRHTSRNLARHLSGVALLALAACSSGGTSGPGGLAGSDAAASAPNVGVLLPLTGANGVLGNEMLAAAKLALSKQTGTLAPPKLDIHDTAGAGGAAEAMQAAIASGDGIVLGPLTSADTASIGPMAIRAGIPVIAFTSDLVQARPGVWVFGITPQQQVSRLVDAAKTEGRQHFAAFLPDTPLGHAMGDALVRSCREGGLADPQVVYHAGTAEAIRSGLATLSAYDSRVATASGQTTGPAQDLPDDLAAALSSASKASVKADAQSPGDPKAAPPAQAAGSTSSDASSPTLSSPPFDALLLADTGLALKNVLDALKANQVRSSDVRLMGPGLWGAFAGKLGSVAGAWYAAPDPAARTLFVQQFSIQNHRVPKPLADLPYDAGSLANSVYSATGGKGYPVDLLTQPQGFSGVDGAFTLTENGQTLRKLGIFEIQPGGGARILPAPKPVVPVPGAS